jgi:hypothetical protein
MLRHVAKSQNMSMNELLTESFYSRYALEILLLIFNNITIPSALIHSSVGVRLRL